MKRNLSLLLTLCMLLSLLTACAGGAGTAAPTTAPSVQPSSQPATTIFTDSAGREVEVPTQITKIAVSGPMAQIVLFALAPEMLVGISSEWDSTAEQYLPTEYYQLPLLGQLYGGKGELNLEQLLASDPDVVIDVGEPKETIVEDLDTLQEQTGIPFVHITAYMDSMAEAYRLLGTLLGKEAEAETLAAYCDEIYSKTLAVAGQVKDSKVKLLYCLGDTGLNVIARDSYHAEIIDLLSDNLAVVDNPSSKGTGNEVDLEQIMLWNPDVILFAPESIYDTVGGDPAWQNITAIQNGTYYAVPFGPYNWMGFPPSVNRYLGLIWMAQMFYPDVAQYDLKAEVINYYNLFYHCDLTDAQYEALVAESIGK